MIRGTQVFACTRCEVVFLVVTHWHVMKVEELVLDLMHTGVCLVHPMRKQDYSTALRLLAMRLEEGAGK